MKRLIGITFSIAGLILSVFVINLLMYSFVPSYHDALEAAVEGNSDIPTVTVDEAGNVMIHERSDKAPRALAIVDLEDEENRETPLASNIENDKYVVVEKAAKVKEDAEQEQPQKQIIDKEYHEDCGTGKGYWVITYSDGSTSVE
ncbi:hypothetical protein bpr_I0879 [Butyrivibrio proteoclasticus B316]|uniref:Uncharacterized protein n=1 Tax=Butyrivibrio proteoclasticus (strain ATCC 51982 / DSM 14932 / B316) TaxID=515622 RepID=E0S1E6_BUTPB|nr:hypothetical protein [Butyrivibrio proteoclasticus]ADL33621.1 hypothetical protein bpr_I0879 [Butyrivibrio proteoclasticus B316]